MKLDSVSSERLNILRFPLIIGVVFIHAYGSDIDLQGLNLGLSQLGAIPKFIQDFLSNGIARLAVPLFFILSGYFFFLGFKWSYIKFKSKIKSRFYTLVIPFLFWNIFTLSSLLVAQSIPATSIYFSGSNQLVATFNFYDLINAIFGINKPPIAYQFWFIRDLIVMVALVPFLVAIFKSRLLSTFIFGLTAMLWFCNYWPIYIPSAAAFFFFYFGAYFARFELSLFALDHYGKKVAILYLGILIWDCLTKGQLYNSYLHNLGVSLGIFASLYLTKVAHSVNSVKTILVKLSTYSFFVYALHEPMLKVLKKVTYKVVQPETELLITTLYLIIPIIIIVSSIAVYHILKPLAPNFLRVISGNR